MRIRACALLVALVLSWGPGALAGFAATVHVDGHCDDLICTCPTNCSGHHEGAHAAHDGELATQAMHPTGSMASHAGSGEDGICETDVYCGVSSLELLAPAPAGKGLFRIASSLTLPVPTGNGFAASAHRAPEAPPLLPGSPPPRA